MIFRTKIIYYLFFFTTFLNADVLNYSFNNFGFELFREINNKKDENILISPLSISYALMMVNKGASGTTSSNILSTLNIKTDNVNEYYSLIEEYTKSLTNLSINNAIWIQKDACYLPDSSYISFINTVFKGDAFYVDFSNNTLKIIKDINDWAFNLTNGMIENIVSKDDIQKTTVQALLNTLYFEGKWSTPFDTTKTKLDYFNIDGKKKELYMMNKKNRYPYYSNEEFQLLELKYANTNMSMFIFLPKSNNDLISIINNLDSSKLKENIDSLKIRPGDVYIPKFKVESSYSLKEYLQSMGMNTPFIPHLASFDGFWDYDKDCFKKAPKHHIDMVSHKTNINLDENGVEVAAATVVIINRVTSISPFIEPFIFKANQPFLYIIYDKEYDSIIFIGKYIGL